MSCTHNFAYYSVHDDNYYCIACKQGMGQAYYKEHRQLDEMLLAGTYCELLNFTDEQLKLAIKGTELTLKYCEGRGSYFGLVIYRLRIDLEQLKKCLENRKFREHSSIG